jgi:hypothetical protein
MFSERFPSTKNGRSVSVVFPESVRPSTTISRAPARHSVASQRANALRSLEEGIRITLCVARQPVRFIALPAPAARFRDPQLDHLQAVREHQRLRAAVAAGRPAIQARGGGWAWGCEGGAGWSRLLRDPAEADRAAAKWQVPKPFAKLLLAGHRTDQSKPEQASRRRRAPVGRKVLSFGSRRGARNGSRSCMVSFALPHGGPGFSLPARERPRQRAIRQGHAGTYTDSSKSSRTKIE